MIWFTADTHFGHFNIIKYCNRPFQSIEEMDNTIINNINLLVKPEDTLYHLGDFCFGKSDIIENTKTYLNRIKCKNIIIVAGNHDPHYADGTLRNEFGQLFRRYYNLLRIKVTDEQANLHKHTIVMCHYAMRIWDKSHFGSWHLFGHSHNTLLDNNSLSCDVGVDAWNYMPVSLCQIANKISNQKVDSFV